MEVSLGESLHCALLFDYVPPKEPPLETPFELGDSNCLTNPHNVAKAVNGNRNFIYANRTSQRMPPMEAMGMLSE